MYTQKINVTITLITLFILLSTFLTGCSTNDSEVQQEDLRLGIAHETLEALVIIALENGYFKEEGLNIIVKEYPSGKEELLGVLREEIDIGSTAEAPIVFKAFEETDFKIIATIASADDQMKLLAKKSSNITAISDLVGKTVVTQQASAADFFLYSLLAANSIAESDVNIIFKPAPELVKAVTNNEADALSMREPYVSFAKAIIGEDNVIIFNPRGIYIKFFESVAQDSFIEEHPQILVKYLKALSKAQQFIESNNEQAKEIVKQYPGMNDEQVDEQWDTVEYKLSLDKSLILSMRYEGIKSVEKGYVDATEVPNFESLIYTDALQEVAPHAIDLN